MKEREFFAPYVPIYVYDTKTMVCAYCGKSREWPGEFPCMHYARCIWCWKKEQWEKNKSKTIRIRQALRRALRV